MSEFHTMYHDAFAKAFFIETPNHERLAVFPYGRGKGDVALPVAKESACKALDLFNGQIIYSAVEARKEICPFTGVESEEEKDRCKGEFLRSCENCKKARQCQYYNFDEPEEEAAKCGFFDAVEKGEQK